MKEVGLTLLILMGVSLTQGNLMAQDSTGKSYSEVLQRSNLYSLDFDDIDIDDSLDLSLDELLTADHSNDSALFYVIDTNQNGGLDKEEFESWLSNNLSNTRGRADKR